MAPHEPLFPLGNAALAQNLQGCWVISILHLHGEELIDAFFSFETYITFF